MSSGFSERAGMEVEIGSSQAQLGECLGEGAEGAVYELEHRDDRVVKVIKKEKREHKQEKLETMVQDSMNSPEDQPDIPWTAWPVDLVSRPSNGSFLGYVMPYIDIDQHIDAQKYASQNLRWDISSQRERYKPAINLTLTVHWLHQNGYAVGDISEQNVRVNDGTVTLIDCDSYSIEGSDFAGQMEAPRYTPPEGRGTTHEEVKQTDQFGVAVHIFQFLMAGFHPYQAVGEAAVDGPLPEAIEWGDFPYGQSRSRNLDPPPMAPDFRRLPKSFRRGFKQCFSTGQSDPTARPSLKKWLAILSKEGDFDIDGINVSDVTFENEDRDRLSRNWQEDIRQDSNSRQTGSTADLSPTQTGTTTAPSSADDSHWADELRDGQAATTDEKSDQQSTGQKADEPSAIDIGVVGYILALLLVLLLIIVLIL